jgi:hypothetical protein
VRAETRFYSVQPLKPDGSKDGSLVHTDAHSPKEAAEKVVGTPLMLHGKVPGATVWAMAEDYTAVALTLYLTEKQANEA